MKRFLGLLALAYLLLLPAGAVFAQSTTTLSSGCSESSPPNDILCSPINLLISTDDPNRIPYLNRLKQEGVQAIFLSVTSIFAAGAATFGAVAFIYGGFLYVTSHGDEEQLTKAKQFIMYTLLGLVVYALSYVILITIRDILYGQPVL